MPASSETKAFVLVAAQAALNKLGEDVVALDVTEPFALAEVFLIISAKNERQTMAIAEAVEDALAEHKLKARFKEGYAAGRWILLDFGDLIVHVMHDQEREYYSLERLWRDCPVVPIAA